MDFSTSLVIICLVFFGFVINISKLVLYIFMKKSKTLLDISSWLYGFGVILFLLTFDIETLTEESLSIYLSAYCGFSIWIVTNVTIMVYKYCW